MTIELNHTIVWCSDPRRSAGFMAEMLGLGQPRALYHFLVVETGNGVSLDFAEKQGTVSPQHYAFLVGEAEFDGIYRRIRDKGLEHWADPARTRPGEINRNDGGRGVYFLDPDGHVLEALTRPYGSGG